MNIQTYAGTASPYNFNGLVRHYYMRRGPNVADIQVNLLPKGGRDLQSHEIAKRVRLRLEPIARRYGARIKVAEVPPDRRCSRHSSRKYTASDDRRDRAGAAHPRFIQADYSGHRRRLVRGRRSNEIRLARG